VDYDSLRLYVHLSRTLRFLRTSRECHVSPSTLSRSIQRLEQEVGWPLLERDRRTVRLVIRDQADQRPFGMDPTRRMRQEVELLGTVTEDHRLSATFADLHELRYSVW